MDIKHYKELLTDIKVANPEIVDISKKIIVIIGCPSLSNRLVDVVDEVIKAQVDDQSYHDVNFGEKECFDDSHPDDQIKYVKTLVEQLDKDALPKRMFVYTNSPFVLQSFFHFNGRPALNIAYYECGFNENREIVLTDVSADTRSTFARMAEAMNDIMDVTHYFNRFKDSEQQ